MLIRYGPKTLKWRDCLIKFRRLRQAQRKGQPGARRLPEWHGRGNGPIMDQLYAALSCICKKLTQRIKPVTS